MGDGALRCTCVFCRKITKEIGRDFEGPNVLMAHPWMSRHTSLPPEVNSRCLDGIYFGGSTCLTSADKLECLGYEIIPIPRLQTIHTQNLHPHFVELLQLKVSDLVGPNKISIDVMSLWRDVSNSMTCFFAFWLA